jgi:hypothetical protein
MLSFHRLRALTPSNSHGNFGRFSRSKQVLGRPSFCGLRYARTAGRSGCGDSPPWSRITLHVRADDAWADVRVWAARLADTSASDENEGRRIVCTDADWTAYLAFWTARFNWCHRCPNIFRTCCPAQRGRLPQLMSNVHATFRLGTSLPSSAELDGSSCGWLQHQRPAASASAACLHGCMPELGANVSSKMYGPDFGRRRLTTVRAVALSRPIPARMISCFRSRGDFVATVAACPKVTIGPFR